MVYIFSILSFLLLAFSLRYNWWRFPVGVHVPRVLMYHMIKKHCDRKKRNKWRVKPQDFEYQIAWLAKNNWKSYTISELVEMNTLPKKAVCITFDDGFKDNLTNALPILEKYGFKATIYLVPDSKKNKWETFKDNNFDALLNNADIKKMLNTGRIEFGSHTTSHCNLTAVSLHQAKIEIEQSKEMVEAITNKPCKAFAYPYGKYNEELVKLVEKYGYTSATVVERGFYKKGSPFQIKRLGMLGTESFFDFYLKFTRGRNKL